MFLEFNQGLVFLALMTLLYFLSRRTIQELFYILLRLFPKKVAYSLVAVLFFPGTVVHEVAHFLMATILFMRVQDMKLLPEWQGNNLKLGSVLYEKQDALRGIIVGTAPIIAGLFIFLLLANWNIHTRNSVADHLIFFYVVFVISTTMFSSKQDLADLMYVLPFILLLCIVLYVLDVPVIAFVQESVNNMSTSLAKINQYLLYSVGVHVMLITLFKLVKKH